MQPASVASTITILGASGSGKSTLADRLALLLDLPAAVHLDDLYFKHGWVERDGDDFRNRIRDALRQQPEERWIVDGNFSRLGVEHWKRTRLFVILDPPYLVTLFRLVRRTLRRIWTREPLFGQKDRNACVETLGRTLLHRDSILLYSFRWWWTGGLQVLERRVRETCPDTPVVTLRSTADVDRFVASLTSQHQADPRRVR
ncbi:hypothetical protein HKX48_000218 [Thoreauomyces humboldtii]|nr:hypothetical protein HKX48_000218 [Thoreauomyces humboldtii]